VAIQWFSFYLQILLSLSKYFGKKRTVVACRLDISVSDGVFFSVNHDTSIPEKLIFPFLINQQMKYVPQYLNN
jgi:hypothetical protein